MDLAYTALVDNAWQCTVTSPNHSWVLVWLTKEAGYIWHSNFNNNYYLNRWRTCTCCGVLERRTSSNEWHRHSPWWVQKFALAVGAGYVMREDTSTTFPG